MSIKYFKENKFFLKFSIFQVMEVRVIGASVFTELSVPTRLNSQFQMNLSQFLLQTFLQIIHLLSWMTHQTEDLLRMTHWKDLLGRNHGKDLLRMTHGKDLLGRTHWRDLLMMARTTYSAQIW